VLDAVFRNVGLPVIPEPPVQIVGALAVWQRVVLSCAGGARVTTSASELSHTGGTAFAYDVLGARSFVLPPHTAMYASAIGVNQRLDIIAAEAVTDCCDFV
jgi:hypothetical protein